MADSALETVSPPFMTFRFEVVLDLNEPLPGVPSTRVARNGFTTFIQPSCHFLL